MDTVFEADRSVTFASIGEDEAQVRNWHLEVFSPVSDYQAALVVEGNDV